LQHNTKRLTTFNLDFRNYQNLIFDLGGVIINIEMSNTVLEFSRITGKSVEEISERIKALQIYYRYEVGELDDLSFRELIRGFIGSDVDDQTIDKAWNALLLDIPAERIQVLKKLKKSHKLFLLSNTNPIHFKEVENILRRTTGDSFYTLFDKLYLSYDIRLIKPEKEVYKYVLNDQNIKAADSVFIDDNLINVEAASDLGIKGVHLTAPTTIVELFK
jgi:glucose-1-phosphatase